MVLEMTPNTGCVKPTMKQSLILFLCPKRLQKEYKRQHDWMGKTVHWDICKKAFMFLRNDTNTNL